MQISKIRLDTKYSVRLEDGSLVKATVIRKGLSSGERKGKPLFDGVEVRFDNGYVQTVRSFDVLDDALLQKVQDKTSIKQVALQEIQDLVEKADATLSQEAKDLWKRLAKKA